MKTTLKTLFALLLCAALALCFAPHTGARAEKAAEPQAAKAAPGPIELLPYRVAGYSREPEGVYTIKVVVKDRYMSTARLLNIAADLARGEPLRGYVLFYCEGDCIEDGASVAVVGGLGERFSVLSRIDSWRGAPSETQFRRYGYYRSLYNSEPGLSQSELAARLAERYAIEPAEAAYLIEYVAPFTKPAEIAAPFQPQF